VKLDPESSVEPLSDPERDLLSRYSLLLSDKAIPLGLISEGDKGHVWSRHVADSLRALPCLPRAAGHIVDVGTGAGLPGIPLAICRPDSSVTLIDPKTRAVSFLELAVESLGLPNVRVLRCRAEEADIQGDVAVSRAFANQSRAAAICGRLVGERGFVLYFAGSTWRPDPSADIETQEHRWSWDICSPAVFPWQGPIVRMSRSQEELQTP